MEIFYHSVKPSSVGYSIEHQLSAPATPSLVVHLCDLMRRLDAEITNSQPFGPYQLQNERTIGILELEPWKPNHCLQPTPTVPVTTQADQDNWVPWRALVYLESPVRQTTSDPQYTTKCTPSRSSICNEMRLNECFSINCIASSSTVSTMRKH